MGRDPRGYMTNVPALRIARGESTVRDEAIAVEVPVVVRFGDEAFSLTCTPCDLEDLAFGLSFSSGLIERADDVCAVSVCEEADGFAVLVEPTRGVRRKNSGAPVSAGPCSASGAPALPGSDVGFLPEGPRIAPEAIWEASDELFALQGMHQDTGATHAAMFVDCASGRRLVREDIGRHIAIDKLIGAMLREGVDPAGGFMFLSSRCALDLAIRCARFGIAIVATISAPTSAVVEFGERVGMTLAAFARKDRFTVYTHPERVEQTGRGGHADLVHA